jgi:hypothetical protein
MINALLTEQRQLFELAREMRIPQIVRISASLGARALQIAQRSHQGRLLGAERAEGSDERRGF